MSPEDVIAGALGVPRGSLTETSSAETVGEWDSLSHIHVIIEIENVFGVSLSPSDALDMTSVSAIKAILRRHNVSL